MNKSTLSYGSALKIDRRTLIAVGILLGTFIGHQAYSAESSIDFMCKAQAKEIAAQTYKSCVVESKQMEIERIRNEYKEKLEALKQQYSSELNSLSEAKAKKAENEAAPAPAVIEQKTEIQQQTEPQTKAQPTIELKKKSAAKSTVKSTAASKTPAKNNKLSKKSTSTSKVTATKEITEELIASPYEEEDAKRQSAEPKVKSEQIDLTSSPEKDAMELSITRVKNPEMVELPYQEE